MKSQEEFQQFVREKLIPQLRPAEKFRRRFVWIDRVSRLAGICFPLAMLSLFGSGVLLALSETGVMEPIESVDLTTVMGFAFAALPVSGVLWVSSNRLGNHFFSKYKDAFQSQAPTRQIVNFAAPGVAFEKDRFVPLERMKESELFPEHREKGALRSYGGDDYFSGAQGETPFELSEIMAVSAFPYTDNDGKRRMRSVKTNGLFLAAEFSKPIQGKTFILPDSLEKKLGVLGSFLESGSQKIGGKNLQLVKMEDPIFEKNFRVLSSDDQEARYILSPGLMQRLVNVLEKSDQMKSGKKTKINGKTVHVNLSAMAGEMRCSLIGKTFFLYLDTGPLFFSHAYNSVLQPETFQIFYDDLSMALGLVEELTLNTRISGPVG